MYVERRLGSTLLVRVGSQRIHARMNGDVQPGNWYRVMVVRSGPSLVLRTVESRPVPLDSAALARSHGLPAGAEAVVRAFVQSGLPLQNERLALAWRMVRSSSRLSISERARLAAVLEDKGLLGSRAVYDRAVAAAGGDHEQRRDQHARDQDDSAEERRHESASADDVVALAEGLRRAFGREDENGDLLQLINHRAGREENWVIVPLEFVDAPQFTASVKMRLPLPAAGSEGGPPGFAEAILDVRDEANRWTFGIRPAERTLRVTLLAAPAEVSGSESDLRPALAPLERRLDALGLFFDLLPMSKDSNDGFSHDERPAIIRRVDSSV